MTLTQFFFRFLKVQRDVRAVQRGRIPQRLWNRVVSHEGWKLLRKLYR